MSIARELAWQRYDLESRFSMSYTLAEYALRLKYEMLPKEIVHEAKRAILDSLGCAIGGHRAPARPICEAAIREIGGSPESTVFGSGLRTSAPNAALVNSLMVRFMDYNDVGTGNRHGNGHGNHNSDSMASILAVCEREKASGQDLITSLVIAYELGFRISSYQVGAAKVKASSDSEPKKVSLLDARASLIMPPALGKVMKLNEEQIANAIGICASHSFALGVIMSEGPTMSKDIRFGYIAHDAILCCLLAKHGFTGPVRVFDSNSGLTGLSQVVSTQLETNPARIMDFTGWRFGDTRYKYYRGCAGLHGQVEATLSIVKENDIKPEDVASVQITCSTMYIFKDRLPFKYPRLAEAADHSPYYANAIAIKERTLGPDSYEPENFTDPVVLDLIEKTTLVFDPEMPSEGGACKITTKDGRTFEKRVDNPHGFYEDPLSDRELENKFSQMAERYMDQGKIQRIFDSVWNLENLKDISELTSKMVW